MKSHEQTKDVEDWQPGALTFKTPKDAGWAQVRLEVSSAEPQKKFSVWWDDFVLSRADDKPVGYEQPTAWTPRGDPFAANPKEATSASTCLWACPNCGL